MIANRVALEIIKRVEGLAMLLHSAVAAGSGDNAKVNAIDLRKTFFLLLLMDASAIATTPRGGAAVNAYRPIIDKGILRGTI